MVGTRCWSEDWRAELLAKSRWGSGLRRRKRTTSGGEIRHWKGLNASLLRQDWVLLPPNVVPSR